MSNQSSDPSRRRFLVFMGGAAVGTFLLPGSAADGAGIPSTSRVGQLAIDGAEIRLDLVSPPYWARGIPLGGNEAVDVLVYELGDGDRQMWWAADDEELAEMHRFYEATRTPGRPLVDPRTIFPIRRSDEEKAHLKAIVADLDSNVPRLAYANWLERKGEPLGEFIRLQSTPASEFSESEFERRQARIKQLLEQYAKSWLLPLAAIGIWPTMGTRFLPELFLTRGMIECVLIHRSDVLPAETKRLWDAAPALSRLIIACKVDVPGLVAQPEMGQIKDLSLISADRDNERERMLAIVGSPNLGSLRKLSLSASISDVSIAALCRSDLLAQLMLLDLGKCFLSAQAVSMLASCPRVRNLKALALGGCKLDEAAGKRMAESPYLRELENLSFCFNDSDQRAELPADALRAMLAGEWRKLRKLDLSQCVLGDEGAQVLAESPGLSNVQELVLNNTEIGVEGVFALADSPYLNRLNTISVAASDEGRERLVARLRKNQARE